jgi:glycosyltransferase involved in cell wall biosynthesis
MRIAQVAPLYESTPPRFYGGIERAVSYLTEELVRQGHEVTLFATGDSRTRAELIASAPSALRLARFATEHHLRSVIQLEQVRQRVRAFDVIHFHTDFAHFPLSRTGALGCHLMTFHGRLNLPQHRALFNEFKELPVVGLSNYQRMACPDANWIGTVPYGLPATVCRFEENPKGGYLAFLGRISPEKRPDWAIETARRVGLKLKIAAKVDPVDSEYFREMIEPLIEAEKVEFIGEIDEEGKSAFLGNANAVLFPVDWPEAFGLVLIEAMSCGTPVVAWDAGAIREVVDNGLTGYVVNSIETAVDAIERVPALARAAVRKRFEERFLVERMAQRYLDIYRALLDHRAS